MEVRVEDGVLRQAGLLSAVIASDDVDLEALDPSRRAAAIGAFARLCRRLDFELQIVVRIRRLPPTWCGPAAEGERAPARVGAPGEPPAGGDRSGAARRERHALREAARGRLEAAMRAHWRAELSRAAVFTRSIAFVATLGASDPAGLERAAATVLEALAGTGVAATRLRGGELATWVRESIGRGQPPWRDLPRHAIVGGVWCRGHSLRRLPGAPVCAGWLAPLLGVQAACDVALHLSPASAPEAVSQLARRLRRLSAQQLHAVERGDLTSAWDDAAVDSALDLRDRLARNVSRPLHLSLRAIARGEGRHELDRSSHAVRAAVAATLAQVESTHLRHLPAALTAASLGRDHLRDRKLVDSHAAATCVPWSTTSPDDGGGYRLGAVRATGVPVRVDPFDSRRHINANIAILATSGHGKSFAIGALLLEALTHRRSTTVIDPEEEHAPLVRGLGGEYLSLAPGSGSSINILQPAIAPGSTTATPGATAEVLSAATGLVRLLSGGRLDRTERARVEEAVRDAHRRAVGSGSVPLLEDCLPDLERTAPAVAVVLRRLCAGPLGEVFNRPTSLRLDGEVTGISFRDLHPEFVGAATLAVSHHLWSTVQHRTGRRHIVFDEVGMLASHPPLRHLLVQLARRCRKYGASLVVATQNALDLLNNDEGRVVATNCAILLLGGHRPAETAVMERAFGLTEGQRRFLENAGRGEFLLVAGSRRTEIRIHVPELHRRLLSSTSVL